MIIELKYRIAEKIIQMDDDALLNEIQLLIGLSKDDFGDEVPDDIKNEVNRAKSELDKRKGIPYSVPFT